MPLARGPLPVSTGIAMFFLLMPRGWGQGSGPAWRAGTFPWGKWPGGGGAGRGSAASSRTTELPLGIAALGTSGTHCLCFRDEGLKAPCHGGEWPKFGLGRAKKDMEKRPLPGTLWVWARDCGASTRQVGRAEVALTSKHSFKNLLNLLWC